MGNLADTVRRAAQAGTGRPALFHEDTMLTWGELDRQVDALARGLRALHLPSSGPHPARVAIALPNVPEFAVALFGALRAGLVVVPVNPGYTPRELREVLGDSGAGVLIGTADAIAAASSAGQALARYHVGPGGNDGAALADLLVPDGDPVDPGTGGEDLALLVYTSGTAGAPKGAMLSHRALLANHAQVARVVPQVIGPRDVVLLALPLFHLYGLNAGLGAVAWHGAAGVLMQRFDPAESLALVARHQVTAIVGVPPMYVAWSLLPELGEALESVRLAVSGAAPLDPAAAARFTATTRRAVFEGYGLTETAPVLTSTVMSPVPKPGSIGRPIPDVELRLVSADGSVVWSSTPDLDQSDVDMNELVHEAPESPGSDPGEIVARGPNLFSGYWPDGDQAPDADGWWATGDVAYADADGDLFLVDRVGELILVSGFNVYPREIEQVLESHPDVVEAAVVGRPHPYTGQTVKAFVVRRPGATAGSEELLRHCEQNLARFKCPTAIEFAVELPHSAIGKVRKAALR